MSGLLFHFIFFSLHQVYGMYLPKIKKTETVQTLRLTTYDSPADFFFGFSFEKIEVDVD
jgi:hypothetical protein